MRSLKFWAEEKMVVDDGGVVYFDITYRLYKDCRTFWHSLGESSQSKWWFFVLPFYMMKALNLPWLERS
jgi:hypothetical protein